VQVNATSYERLLNSFRWTDEQHHCSNLCSRKNLNFAWEELYFYPAIPRLP